MRRGEGLALKAINLIMELVVIRHDEALLIAGEGMVDGKCHAASIAMVRKVRWLYSIEQEEGIPPLLRH